MHFKDQCSCGKILAQCRCPSKDKRVNVIKDGCDDCKQKKQDAKKDDAAMYIEEMKQVERDGEGRKDA